MNILYRCPECGNRLFAKPGGTKLHCPKHTDTLFVQVEEYHGPDFLNVEEDGQTESHDAVFQGNTRVPDPSKERVVDPEAELDAIRQLYKTMTGEEYDKRWGAARVKEELMEFLNHSKDENNPPEEVVPEPEPKVAEVGDSDTESSLTGEV